MNCPRCASTNTIKHGSCEELAWAAGFFDGEGHTGQSGRALIMAIGQSSSPFTLNRFRRAVGDGTVYGPYKRGDTRELVYRWQTKNASVVKRVAARLLPFLSPPKRRQIREAFKSWNSR